jgi:hypothetical protein
MQGFLFYWFYRKDISSKVLFEDSPHEKSRPENSCPVCAEDQNDGQQKGYG